MEWRKTVIIKITGLEVEYWVHSLLTTPVWSGIFWVMHAQRNDEQHCCNFTRPERSTLNSLVATCALRKSQIHYSWTQVRNVTITMTTFPGSNLFIFFPSVCRQWVPCKVAAFLHRYVTRTLHSLGTQFKWLWLEPSKGSFAISPSSCHHH